MNSQYGYLSLAVVSSLASISVMSYAFSRRNGYVERDAGGNGLNENVVMNRVMHTARVKNGNSVKKKEVEMGEYGVEFSWRFKIGAIFMNLSEYVVLMMMLLAVFLSGLGYSVLGYGIVLIFCIGRLWNPIGNKNSHNRNKMMLLRQLDRKTLQALLQDDLPRWVTFPDIEKCEWFNVILRTLWPYVKAAAANSLRKAIQPQLDSNKLETMSTLDFSAFDLGTSCPMAMGIKSYSNMEDEEVVVDVDVLFVTEDSDIVFNIGSSSSLLAMSIELDAFKISGTLRIVLKPLFPRWPTFGAVTIGFTEKPVIDFSLKALKVDVMEVPMFSKFLTDLIRNSIAEQCVWPNKIVIPIVKDLNALELEYLKSNRPLGILQVSHISLRDMRPPSILASITGKYSHQLLFSVRSERMTTKRVRKVEEAKFNCPITILVLDPQTDMLNMVHNCRENFTPAKSIGDYSISLKHLEPYKPQSEVLPLQNTTKGTARFVLTWLPFTKPHDDITTYESLSPEMQSMGALFVRLHRVENMRPMDFSGLSDSQVTLTLGGVERHSSIKRKTFNPVWDPPESFEFIVENPRQEVLYVTISDKDYMASKTETGSVKINVNQVRSNLRISQLWSLEANPGSIFLELEWRGLS